MLLVASNGRGILAQGCCRPAGEDVWRWSCCWQYCAPGSSWLRCQSALPRMGAPPVSTAQQNGCTELVSCWTQRNEADGASNQQAYTKPHYNCCCCACYLSQQTGAGATLHRCSCLLIAFAAHLILLGCQQHAPDSNQLQHCAWDTLQAAAATDGISKCMSRLVTRCCCSVLLHAGHGLACNHYMLQTQAQVLHLLLLQLLRLYTHLGAAHEAVHKRH
jgi:hypothetical protein